LEPIADLEGAVREALAAPLGSPPIGELVKPGARVTIAFDDLTVASFGPIRTVAINELLRQLEAAGVPRETVTLICANSLHRKFRPKELAVVLGEDLVKEFGPRIHGRYLKRFGSDREFFELLLMAQQYDLETINDACRRSLGFEYVSRGRRFRFSTSANHLPLFATATAGAATSRHSPANSHRQGVGPFGIRKNKPLCCRNANTFSGVPILER
jgi:hypothetical protein